MFEVFRENRMAYKNGPERSSSEATSEAPFESSSEKNKEDSSLELAEVRDQRFRMSDEMMVDIENYDKTKKILRKMGIPQRKIDKVFNDWTNPYLDWASSTLEKFSDLEIKREKDWKMEYGTFYSTNLDRLLDWEAKIYPKLLEITGGDDGYAEYDFAIREAVTHESPRMKEFLDWHFDSLISNPIGYSRMDSLVKAELDQINKDGRVKYAPKLNKTVSSVNNSMNEVKEEKTEDELRKIQEDLMKRKYKNELARLKSLPYLNDVDHFSPEKYNAYKDELNSLSQEIFGKIENEDVRDYAMSVLDEFKSYQYMMDNNPDYDKAMEFLYKEAEGLSDLQDSFLGTEAGADLQMFKEIMDARALLPKYRAFGDPVQDSEDVSDEEYLDD